MRGNIVMKGYLKNPDASEKAFAGGWFHSGDLGVMHPDGYIELKDRSKDIIISGGENISSIEVESALFKHPAVLDAAVVGKADPKWGEIPCAFVTLKENAVLLKRFCSSNPLPGARYLDEHALALHADGFVHRDEDRRWRGDGHVTGVCSKREMSMPFLTLRRCR